MGIFRRRSAQKAFRDESSPPNKKAVRGPAIRVPDFLRRIPWAKLRPRWPGFRKLFGPMLLLLIVGLFVSYFFLLQALEPERPGREITVTQLFEKADLGLVESARFLDQDNNIIVKVLPEPPPAPPPAPAEATVAKGQPVVPPPPPPPPPPPEPGFTGWLSEPASGAMTAVITDKLQNSPSHTQISFDHQNSKKVVRFLAQFLLPLMILATVFSFFFLIITGQGGQAAEFLGFSRFAAKIQRRRKGKGATTFRDVAAIDEGISELEEVVEFLVAPARFAELGARPPKGVLLVGPPGTGKTLLARAVAGEASVPFIQLSGSEFVESLVGVGAARVRDLFRQARALAPCIVFIDELDAAGRQRGAGVGGGNDEREQTLNQLLVEMDGFSTKLGIVIIGATNRPDILDPALLRPGRFDRQIVIDVPDVKGRTDILKVHSRGRPMAPDCNLDSVARQTPGFTGADLANIMNEASLMAVRRGHHQIAQEDLEEAVDRVIAGPERRSHILTEEEKLLIAYHEAGHAVVAWGAGQDTGVLKLSIIARGLQLGHASTYSSADRLIMLRSELEGQITALLGGMAAEKLLFGEVSTGNARDLEKATTLARKLVATYGMTETVGGMQVIHEGQVFMGRDFASLAHTSSKTLDAVDDEIKGVFVECERRALEICKANRPLMDEIVQELLERETMTGPELDPYLSKVKRLEIPKSIAALLSTGGDGGPKGRRQVRRPVDIAAPEREPT